MKRTLQEIVNDAGGRLLVPGDEAAPITGFCTDSREARQGLLFVPIRGEKVDGHRFIGTAFQNGASASFMDEEYFSAHPELPAGGPLILVPDCRDALQNVAAAYRETLSIPIVGITGSVGKTTAKEMVAQALTAGFAVHKTPGNHNSQLGVPMTVCGIEKEHTAAVIEMGVSMPGEMARIARVVKPTCAVITNIGTAHIEFMRTKENTMAQKARIADYLPAGGKLFVNGDDELLPTLKESRGEQLVTFGLSEGCDWRAADIKETAEGTCFTCMGPGEHFKMFVPAAGAHNVRNALCSMAVARFLKLPAEAVVRSVAAYRAPAQRQQIGEYRGITVIDDSYNASPDSMRSAIDVLVSRPVTGKRAAVLADMLELGDYTRQGHFDTGRYAKEKGVELLIAVGPLSQETAKGYGDGAYWFADNDSAAAFLKEQLLPGDAVLVKGSHSMRVGEIAKVLM